MNTPSNSEAVREARIDLAAALRWADRLGLAEGVCNHFSLQVPGTTDRFLFNPQGLHWSEIRAGDLVIVDAAGNLIDGRYDVEPTAFFIHSQIHGSRSTAKCVMHTHMPYATALCCVEGGRLEWCSQNSLRFYQRVEYDDEYNGLALDPGEGDRISSKLASADVMFLAAHGVIITAQDVALAFDDLYYLERACMHQVLAQSTGLPLKTIPEHVCRATGSQFAGGTQQAYMLLEAIRRVLARESPEFADC